jgi:hypothetical protein
MDINTKKNKFLTNYFECVNKAAKDFKIGKPVDHQVLYALNDVIRTMNHIDKQIDDKKKEL